MKNTVTRLVRLHTQLLAQPYGKRRNAQLWSVQSRLERHGIFNRNGRLVRA